MSAWLTYYHTMDQWLMPLYRFPENAMTGFLLGTAVLALVSVILGDVTFNIAVWMDRKRIGEFSRETIKRNNQSIEAIQVGDGEAYRACNKLANEAFGRMFFLQVALSASSLWPLPFALAWMQYRFFAVEFPMPLVDISLGFAGAYLPLYVLWRILFGRIKGRLPFFRTSKQVFGDVGLEAGRMKSWRELMEVPETTS